MKCAIRGCGSYAINHHSYERDGSDPDLCDVHYWQKRATLAEVVRARIQPGQYAHIVPDGNRLTVEIGPKPEPPEPRWKVGDKCDPMDPPPIGTWLYGRDILDHYGPAKFPPKKFLCVNPGRVLPWVDDDGALWRHAWIAQPPPGERQPWEVE